MAGAGLVRKAMRHTGLVQEDFAAHILWCSRRTLTRILAGERPLKPREVAKLREVLRSGLPRAWVVR